MDSLITVQKSANISLWIQIITGIVSLHGLFINVPSRNQILVEILKLEVGVQFVEFAFYYWMVSNFASFKSIHNLASMRYLDWFITTPIMLLATIAFMKHQEQKDKRIYVGLPVITR